MHVCHLRSEGQDTKAMNTSEDTKPWQWWIRSSAQQGLSPGLKEAYSWLGDDILALTTLRTPLRTLATPLHLQPTCMVVSFEIHRLHSRSSLLRAWAAQSPLPRAVHLCSDGVLNILLLDAFLARLHFVPFDAMAALL